MNSARLELMEVATLTDSERAELLLMRWNASRIIVAGILVVLVISVVVRLSTLDRAMESKDWFSLVGAAAVFGLGVMVFRKK